MPSSFPIGLHGAEVLFGWIIGQEVLHGRIRGEEVFHGRIHGEEVLHGRDPRRLRLCGSCSSGLQKVDACHRRCSGRRTCWPWASTRWVRTS
uniref:Uncharacterized protein n=1 Tax=Arundo donax TaxID=35708 RepID=A0A0A8ZWG7_ARUDO